MDAIIYSLFLICKVILKKVFRFSFLSVAWGDPWKWSDILLTQKNSTRGIKKKTLADQAMPVWKAIKYLKAVTSKKQCLPSQCYSGGVGRCAQAKQWGWTRGWWPKKSVEFLCTCLNMQRVMPTEGFGCRFSGHWTYSGEERPRMCCWAYKAHGQIKPCVSFPTTSSWSSLKRKIVPKPEEEGAEKKKIPQKKLKKQNLQNGNKFSIK
jgi:large subunit ribosomal protein L17e